MSSPESHQPDPIDALAGTGPSLPDTDDLLRSVLARTTRVIRHRRRLRRCCLAAALLVCYIAGAATVQLRVTGGPGPEGAIAVDDRSSSKNVRPTARIDRIDQSGQQAALEEVSGFEALRRLSDRYLHEKHDLARALPYYCLALDVASDEERAISAEDSWLLMALKDLDKQGTRYERNDR